MGAIEPVEVPTVMQRVRAVRPQATGVRYVSDVVADSTRCVFHAGPPYRSLAEVPVPVLHSAAQAALFEGWSDSVDEAIAAVRSGAIVLSSAQDHRLLVPLSGVLTGSMAVLEIADAASAVPAVWVALNEGQVHATRLGRLDDGLVPHLQWLNTAFAEWLASCFEQPLALLPLIAQARAQGDDCHARTVAGSQLIAAQLLQRRPHADSRVQAFLHDSPAFALNFWMAAAALAARAVEGEAGVTLVTRAGGNGVEFGIQLAARPGHWICEAAPVPHGAIEPAHASRRAVGALGDSAVVDFSGLGGQSLRFAPQLREAMAAVLPPDALARSEQIGGSAADDVADGLRATAASACVASGTGPLVLIGMIDAQGEAGRIGGGLVDVPAALFQRALASC